MRAVAYILLSALCLTAHASDLHHTWHINGIQTQTWALPTPTTVQHYQGNLSFSQLPKQTITFGWQDRHGQPHLLARTQQNEVPIYWSAPAHATHLWIKTAHVQTLNATLELKAHAIQAQHHICDNERPESKVLQQLQTQLAQQPDSQHAQILNQFWRQRRQHHTPIIEPIDTTHSRLTYIWRGAHNNVRLLGGPSNDHDWLQRLPHSDVWYKEYTVPHAYRGSYVFAVDVPYLQHDGADGCDRQQAKESRPQRLAILGQLQLDPYNPNTLIKPHSNSTQRNENVVMAQATANDQTTVATQSITTEPAIFSSHILNNQRHIDLYRTPNPSQQAKVATLIFLDGEQYTESVDVPRLLEKMVLTGRIQPVQAVFVHNPSSKARGQELPPNDAFVRMMDTELLPWLRTQLPHPIDAQNTVIIGSSLGGLAAAHLGLQLPQHFSHVVALSGSFWWQQAGSKTELPFIAQSIHKQKPQAVKWFLSANSYETGRHEAGILETSRQLQQVLQAQQQEVLLREYVGGHNYVVWEKALQAALEHFYAPIHHK